MPTTEKGRSAVQYLRMSTDHQRYSLESQAEAVARYSTERGYALIGTYVDAGRSGLTLKGRPGLQRLLADVLKPDRGFSTILVLDVSRWGRFQDTDQAAYYEFFCRQVGVDVRYCAEQFENDGSGVSTIIKGLKRVMAAEFSRELGEKVLAGQLRGARLGFKQGGTAPFGIRRKVIDESGQDVTLLREGDRKAVQSHRVVYVPGPEEEVAIVQTIFQLYTRRRMGQRAIARKLNAEGKFGKRTTPWKGTAVRNVLLTEAYLGDYIYNKTTQRMRGGTFQNPSADWVRTPMFEPIIDRKTFAAAARRMASMAVRRYTEETLLDHLRALNQRAGALSCRILAAGGPPTLRTYVMRFGSFQKAAARAGCDLLRYPNWRTLSNDDLLDRLRAARARHGRLSAKLMDTLTELPSYNTIRRRFGTIYEAYRLVGGPPQSTSGP